MSSASGPDELGADHRPAEEAHERRRGDEALPEAADSAKTRASAIRARSTKDIAQPLTVMVPTCPSASWNVHTKG